MFLHVTHDFNWVQNLHDDMEDMLEMANEVGETLGRAYGLPDDVDEDDLEAGRCVLKDKTRSDG